MALRELPLVGIPSTMVASAITVSTLIALVETSGVGDRTILFLYFFLEGRTQFIPLASF